MTLEVSFHLELHITKTIAFHYKKNPLLQTKWSFSTPEFCNALLIFIFDH